VQAVLIGADMKAYIAPMKAPVDTPTEFYGVAVDKVRYVGEPVAVVCATDRYRAEEALDLIKVEYRPLPAVVDPVAACALDAPVLHERIGSNVYSTHHFVHGEPDKAFAEA